MKTGFGGLTVKPEMTIAHVAESPAPILTLTGVVGYTYIIETSTDLINWTPMAAVTLDTATAALLNDPAGMASTQRFYRAVSP